MITSLIYLTFGKKRVKTLDLDTMLNFSSILSTSNLNISSFSLNKAKTIDNKYPLLLDYYLFK